MNGQAGVFAAVFIALYVGHQVGDHWVQTSRQAMTKGQRDWAGVVACAGHVLSLTLVKMALLKATSVVLGFGLTPWQFWLAIGVDAVTHYWADRRFTLARLAGRTGKAGFYQLGAPRPGRDDNPSLGTGAYALDQSWHIAWLLVAALIIAA